MFDAFNFVAAFVGYAAVKWWHPDLVETMHIRR